MKNLILLSVTLLLFFFFQSKSFAQQGINSISIDLVNDSLFEARQTILNNIATRLNEISDPEEMESININSSVNFGLNSPTLRRPINPNNPQYQLDPASSIRSSTNYYTKAVKAELGLLISSAQKLGNVPGQSFTNKTPSEFDFYIYPYKMNNYEALEYYNSLDPSIPDQKAELDYYKSQCLLSGNCSCNTAQEISSCTIAGRLSVYAKIGYNDVYIIHNAHNYGGNPIPTVFNVGRLCPPKCQK